MIQKAIYSLLINNGDITDLVSTRIYPMVRDQKDGLPAITYQVIGGVRRYTFDGPMGMVAGRVQINCFASTLLAAAELAAAVRGVLDGYQGSPESVRLESIFFEDQGDLPVIAAGNEEQNVYAQTLDFQVTYKE